MSIRAALVLAALSLSAAAQSISQLPGGGANLRASGISGDGQRIVASTGSDILVHDITTGLWTSTSSGPYTNQAARISTSGLFISADRPDPTFGNAITAARYDGSSGVWTSLGGLAGQSGTSKSTAYDISGDGSVVVGLAWVTAGEAHAFRWTPAGGLQDLTPAAGFSSRANGVSHDGAAVVGWQQTGARRATRWMGGVQTFLGSLDPVNPVFGGSEALGVNNNGSVVVGTSVTNAFRWTASGGMQNLGKLPTAQAGYAVAVSDDGETVVGWSGANFLDAKAVVWRPEYGASVVDLGAYLLSIGVNDAALWTMRFASDVSADGTVITGWGVGPSGGNEPFRVVLPRVPVSYCTAGTTTSGCNASIWTPEQPSASFARPCVVTVTDVEGQRSGLVFFSASGQNNLPWATGSSSFFCVKTPVQRTPIQSTGGTVGTCTGAMTLDWNAFRLANPGGLGAPWGSGQKTWMQGWFRDPPATKTTNLSNGLELTHTP